jgi:hypothetical protein
MRLLLCGDSFSYNHEIAHSWPTRLSRVHQIDNLSQCGCGEYKIKLQIASCDLSDYDAVLIFHTSPTRIHYNRPNTMHIDKFHAWSDLLFSDVEHHRHKNTVAQIAYDYFVNIFDADYYCYVHDLICADIDQKTKQHRTYHFTAFDYSDLYQFDNKLITLYNTWNANRGDVNHLTKSGHDEFFNQITSLLT